MSSGQWFRKRIGSYSDEIGKSFTEAKARVQRGLEQLKLKNAEAFKRIPSFRGSFRGKKESRKSSSPRKSPKKSERSRASKRNSGSEMNATYRISRKPFVRTAVEPSSSSESELDETERTPIHSSTLRHQPLNVSHSFPRVSRSRKIENINIVFAKPYPPPDPSPRRGKPDDSYSVEAKTSTPKNQMRLESCHSNLSVIHKEPSSFDMDNLRRVVAEIHARSIVANPLHKPPRSKRNATFLKSPVGSLERHTSPEEEDSSDSELAQSTDISFKSYDDSGDDEPRSSPPLPIAKADGSSDDDDDDDVYWIPRKIFNLPRTSSRLSMQSRSSHGGGALSPGLSPIKSSEKRQLLENQMRRAWGQTYNLKKDKTARRLFSIEETTIVADSGYSDRSGVTSRPTSSRATMYELQNRWRLTPSPTSSMSPSPILEPQKNNQDACKLFSGTGPYLLKSFYV